MYSALRKGVSVGILTICLAMPVRLLASYDQTVIDEVVASYDGDSGQQYIEMQMLAASQNTIAHGILAVFNANGSYVADLLQIPSNVPNSGAGVRWLVATADFVDAHPTITADFTMPKNILPAGGGMLCFGGGGGSQPQNPPTWNRTDFANYVDCLAYGNYSGASNALTGTPTDRAPLDHALQRSSETNNNSVDFSCSDALTPTNNAGTTLSLVSTIPCTCGDGILSGNEDCDDGNQVDGDCCSRACDFEIYGSPCAADTNECTQDICNGAAACIHPPSAFGLPCTPDTNECTDDICDGASSCSHPPTAAGTPCTGDASECTDDVCDGASACSHPPIAFGTPCTADTNICTDDYCDGAGACSHPNNTAPCDDSNLCTEVDTCSGGSCVGDETPRSTCYSTVSQRSLLLLKNDSSVASKDRLKWKWTKGSVPLAALGDPASTTDYALCVYDHSGPAGADKLRLDPIAPHGGTCTGGACWTTTATGAKYVDKDLSPDGIKLVKVKADTGGASTLLVKGQGANLALPALPLTAPVTVQLTNSEGQCFGATFSTPTSVSDPTKLFKAKSD